MTNNDELISEELTGNNCPNCGYPTVYEFDLEVCYKCGWYKEENDE